MNTSNDPLAAIRDAIAALPDKHAAPLAEALDTITALVAAARELAQTEPSDWDHGLVIFHVVKPDMDALRAALANFPESKA